MVKLGMFGGKPMREPKRFECLECGSKSKRHKTIKFEGIGFARCFKCGGRVKEREEWISWLREEQKEFFRRGGKSEKLYQ
jgi:NAD-dependent SIR2 family protein deacetylase